MYKWGYDRKKVNRTATKIKQIDWELSSGLSKSEPRNLSNISQVSKQDTSKNIIFDWITKKIHNNYNDLVNEILEIQFKEIEVSKTETNLR